MASTPASAKPVGPHREALEHLRAGDWQTAHAMVQELDDPLAAHIHALVHRMEGDMDNARYWYRRARVAPKSPPTPIEEEIQAISALL